MQSYFVFGGGGTLLKSESKLYSKLYEMLLLPKNVRFKITLFYMSNKINIILNRTFFNNNNISYNLI